MIILVSFWTPSLSGFEKTFTLDNYRTLFGSDVYWNQLKDSFFVALIVVGACLLLGFPIAYFLTFKVKSLRNQIALFLVLLAPFLTSYLIRAVAWEYPLMGRQGADQPGAPEDRADRRAARHPRASPASRSRSR